MEIQLLDLISCPNSLETSDCSKPGLVYTIYKNSLFLLFLDNLTKIFLHAPKDEILKNQNIKKISNLNLKEA